jgi:hypothetical protein
VLSDATGFPFRHHAAAWEKLQRVVLLRRERRLKDKTTIEVVYYISSLPPQASFLLKVVCAYWSVKKQPILACWLLIQSERKNSYQGSQPVYSGTV